MRVLAGDIGGTHARLAIVDIDDTHVRIVGERQYPSHDFPSLAPIVQHFLSGAHEPVARAAFGVAGPVSDGRSATPNLPWTLDERHLAHEIGIAGARLLNDLDAIGRGIARLDSRDLITLQAGAPQEHGVRALIGAGTGLGEAYATWDGTRYRTHPSEGGHGGFAPRTALERELGAWLATDLGEDHVSCERVLSGPGLVHIYRFLVRRDPGREQPAVRDAVAADGGAAVSRHALDGSDALSVAALDLFAAAYGAQAGNLALTVLAQGGVYVVGGIAPAIVKKLVDGTFLAAFRDKGRLADLMKRIPVHVVMNGDVGLYGAALAAWEDGGAAPPAPGAANTTTTSVGAR